MAEEEYYYEDKSCVRAQCKCLCGGGACRFCCSCCPSVRESTSTRLMYVFFLFVAVAAMAAMMSQHVQDYLKAITNQYNLCEECDGVIGYMAVYRLGLAVATYHFLLMCLTFGIKSSKDCRASLHNGLWLYKTMLLIGLCVAVFFIPDPKGLVFKVWMYVAMVGAALFIVIQLILLVFMVHRWTDKIVRRVNDGSSACFWYGFVVYGVTLFNYSACVSVTLFLYYFFATERGCYRNQWFIILNITCCLIVSFVAGCRSGNNRPSLRLFQASLISLYVQYLTWAAIVSAPRRFQTYIPAPITGGGQWTARYTSAQYLSFYCGPGQDRMEWTDAVIPYISVFITLCTVIYASISISNPDSCRDLEFPDCPVQAAANLEMASPHKEDIGGQVVTRNERVMLSYSYPLFHVMLGLASLFMMVSLTEWYTPSTARLSHFGRSWSAYWIKIVSSWICLIIYLLCMAFPSLVPKRYRQHLAVTREVGMGSVSRSGSYYSVGGFGAPRNGSSRSVGRGYFGSNGSLGVAERIRRYSQAPSMHSSVNSSLDAVPLNPRSKLQLPLEKQTTFPAVVTDTPAGDAQQVNISKPGTVTSEQCSSKDVEENRKKLSESYDTHSQAIIPNDKSSTPVTSSGRVSDTNADHMVTTSAGAVENGSGSKRKKKQYSSVVEDYNACIRKEYPQVLHKTKDLLSKLPPHKECLNSSSK